MSSRLKPKVICVRSLVPKRKNSASSAIWSAVSAARGHLDHRADQVLDLRAGLLHAPPRRRRWPAS